MMSQRHPIPFLHFLCGPAAKLFCGIAVCLGACVAASADEKSDLVAYMDELAQLATSNKFTREDFFDLGHYDINEPGGLLVQVGLNQVDLNDLVGAQATAKALPAKNKCRDCGQEKYDRFLRRLAAALVRAGRLQAAREVLTSHYGEDDWSRTLSLLAMARAQARSGDKEGARRTCHEVSRNVDKLNRNIDQMNAAWLLLEVAQTQGRIGMTEAAQTVKQAEALINMPAAKATDRGFLLARLALTEVVCGHRERAAELLGAGPKALNSHAADGLEEAKNSNCWENVAVTYARMGHFDAAIRAVEHVDSGWQGWIFASIAIIQWFNRDLDGAERTILASRDGDLHDVMLLEIARARGVIGDDQKALATMRQIKNNLRRAEATLEIGAAMANRGKKREALDLARKIDYLRVGQPLGPGRTRFEFDDPSTWGEPYEASNGFTRSSTHRGEDMDGDLLASAVHCRTALDGHGSVRGPANAKDWDVRKTARAQASEGDVAGALIWVDRLPRAPRIGALLGAAEGYVEYQIHKGWKPTIPVRLNRHLEAVRDNFFIRDLIEDE
jgi:hypothetical protein